MHLFLLHLQGPVQDALSISSMENRQDAIVPVHHLNEIDKWLNFHLSLTNKAEKLLEYCPPAMVLPPYPALGLAWAAMANNANSIDLPTSKSIHSLVNSITMVNVNKNASSEKVPVPTLPGVRLPSQVAIRPRSNQSLIMLSKVLIKDHLHHEQIVKLAKEIHASEPKHLHKGKNARDYLLQAKTMFESSASNSPPANPVPPRQQKSAPMRPTSSKVSFATIVKEGKTQGPSVFPPKLGPTGILISQKPKSDWQTVQHKKATQQGTKANMVLGIIPVAHQIPREMLLSTNEEALTRHFAGILDTVPGADVLLINNPLKCAAWSLNRDILHTTFTLPLDDNLCAMTHHAFRHFFNVSDDLVPLFIECPTISSIKWAHIPCYDADNKEIME